MTTLGQALFVVAPDAAPVRRRLAERLYEKEGSCGITLDIKIAQELGKHSNIESSQPHLRNILNLVPRFAKGIHDGAVNSRATRAEVRG